MKHKILITVVVLAFIAAALYAAHAMDLAGMIVRGHGGLGGHS